MERKHLKPAPGLLIRDPETKALLPIEGKVVKISSYYVRRLQCGDVVIVENAKIEKSPELKKASEVKKLVKEGDK